MRPKFFLSILLAVPFFISVECFAVSERDMQVAGRTFRFIANIPKGPLDVAIVYSDDVAASKQEAENLHRILGTGLKVDKNTLKGELVSVASLDLSGKKIAYVTGGLAEKWDVINQEGNKNNVLLLTTDLSCLEATKCIMNIKSEPSVEISVSKSAAENAKVKLSTALKLIIQEVK